MNIKKTLLVGATVATVSLGGIGGVSAVSAATDSSSSISAGTSLIDKIAAKFNLNSDEVKAVFDEARTEYEADRAADQAERLATAVKDGDIIQEQADYITKALAEIKTLRGDSDPKDEDDTTREAVKAKMDALKTWAEDNDVDMKLIGGGHGGRGMGGQGGFGGGERPTKADTSDESSTDSDSSAS